MGQCACVNEHGDVVEVFQRCDTDAQVDWSELAQEMQQNPEKMLRVPSLRLEDQAILDLLAKLKASSLTQETGEARVGAVKSPLDRFLHLIGWRRDSISLQEIVKHFELAEQDGRGEATGRAEIRANLYYLDPTVSFNGNRAVRSGGLGLTPAHMLLADTIGKYHVGIEFRGREFTYAMPRGIKSTVIGGDVTSHRPTKAGPHMKLKTQLVLGESAASLAEVTALACVLGHADFAKGRYSLLSHNCQTFANAFATHLCCDKLPHWVTRGVSFAASLGCNSEKEVDDDFESLIIKREMTEDSSTNISHCSSFACSDVEEPWVPQHGSDEVDDIAVASI